MTEPSEDAVGTSSESFFSLFSRRFGETFVPRVLSRRPAERPPRTGRTSCTRLDRTLGRFKARTTSSIQSSKKSGLAPKQDEDNDLFRDQLSLPLRLSGFRAKKWAVGDIRPMGEFIPVAIEFPESVESPVITHILAHVFPAIPSYEKSEGLRRHGLKVLDVGCHDGAWLQSVLKEVKDAQCFGI
ncbi:hypothetical protein HDU82_003330, partial [Entophlyctis luteolus]